MAASSVTPDIQQSRIVQYPHPTDPSKQGATVMFPAEMPEESFRSAAASAWQQLSSTSAGRFTKGAYSTTLEPLGDLAHKYWHDVTTPANATGDNFISDLAASIAAGHVDQAHKAIDAFHEGRYTEAAGHAMGAAVPLVGPAAAQAGEAIGKGDVAGGLGQGAGLLGATLLGGKAAEGTEEAEAAAAKPASLKPIAAPAAGEVKPVASMTPTERAAAAYTHKAFGPDTADVELLGHQGTETSTSELKRGTSMEHEAPASTPTHEDVRAFLEKQYGKDAASKINVSIEPEKVAPKATSKEVNEAATAESEKFSKAKTLPSTANWQDIATEQLGGKEKPTVSYQDAEDRVLKDFTPKIVDQKTFESNLAAINKRTKLAETEPVATKVISALLRRHIADSPNPVITDGLVRGGKVPLQDLYGKELAQKAYELDPNPDEVPSHEAGHAVLANHYKAPITKVQLYPSFEEGKYGANRSVVKTNLDSLSPAQKETVIMGGAAGEKVAGFPYNPVHEGGDVIALKNLLGPDEDAPAAIERGRAEANRLLSGELKGQHTQLTDFFKATWGTDQPFENFKHLLGVMGVAVTAPAIQTLWANYNGKKPAGDQQ